MSEPHFHSADSACLERIEKIPTSKHVDGKRVMAPAAHWWRCTYLATLEAHSPWKGIYSVHEHGLAFHAHKFTDHCEFAT